MSVFEIQLQRDAVRPWRAIAFCLLMAFMLLGVAGFASVESVHNAAHDSRHSAAFPCH